MPKRNNIKKKEHFILVHSFKGFGPWSLGSLPLGLWRVKMSWEGACGRQNKGDRGKGVSLRTSTFSQSPPPNLYQLPVVHRTHQRIDLHDEVKVFMVGLALGADVQTRFHHRSLWIFGSTRIKWNLCKRCKNCSICVNQYTWNTSQLNEEQISYDHFSITKYWTKLHILSELEILKEKDGSAVKSACCSWGDWSLLPPPTSDGSQPRVTPAPEYLMPSFP